MATNVSASEGETSNNKVIQVDVNLSSMKNMQVVPKTLEEPDSNIEIDYGPKISKVYYYNQATKSYRYEDLTTYAFLTNHGDPLPPFERL